MTRPGSRLTFIGTVHRDPQGYQRLADLLEELEPQLLTLEMSSFAMRYRQTSGRPQRLRLERILERLSGETGRPLADLQRLPAVAGVRTLLEQPFEYRAARDYAERRQCRLVLVDDSEISARKLKRVESGLITYRNLKILAALPEEAPAGQESYATAQRLLLDDPHPAACEEFLQQRRGVEGIGPRDRAMADQIRRLLERHPDRHLVHVGGWVHLLADPQGETLFSRLAEFVPGRRLLDERRPVGIKPDQPA